jgi:hypothetical protein
MSSVNNLLIGSSQMCSSLEGVVEELIVVTSAVGLGLVERIP